MNTLRMRFGLAALSIVALPADAHHSPANFDLTKELALEGVVTEFSWRNPHVYIALQVDGADGKPVEQQIEAGPAANFVAMGLNADSIRPGDRVVVDVKPNRAGPGRVVLGWRLTKADGRVIPLHVRAMAPAASAAVEASSIAGTWVPQATGFSSLSFAAREWPLTDKGRAAVAATHDARVEARSECVPFGPPALMSLPITMIVGSDESVVTFMVDYMNVKRVVHLDQRNHPVDLEPTLLGHSIGRWEGNTLVVDTVGFAAHPEGYAFDLPSSEAKHVVERFALSADRKHVDYEATIEDSEYLAAPVTHRSQWDYRPEQKPSGLPCDPDAARRFATDE